LGNFDLIHNVILAHHRGIAVFFAVAFIFLFVFFLVMSGPEVLASRNRQNEYRSSVKGMIDSNRKNGLNTSRCSSGPIVCLPMTAMLGANASVLSDFTVTNECVESYTANWISETRSVILLTLWTIKSKVQELVCILQLDNRSFWSWLNGHDG
jgi:hypothetical protein